MGFKRFVNILEIVVGIATLAFVIALFVNEPDDGGGAPTTSPGASVYAANCAGCHGADGGGGVGPQLAGQRRRAIPRRGRSGRGRHERPGRDALVQGPPDTRADRSGRRVHTHRLRLMEPRTPLRIGVFLDFPQADGGTATEDGAAPRLRRGDAGRAPRPRGRARRARRPRPPHGERARGRRRASGSSRPRGACSSSGRRSATTR